MIENHPRILLIDDNVHGLIARRAALEQCGYGVEVAECGREGLAKVEQGGFDLVVTDYRMPDLTGCEVIERIRRLFPAIPIVMLSGYAAALGLTEDSTGADVVLGKGPAEQEDLLRAIARLMRKRPRRSSGRKADAGSRDAAASA